MYDPSSSQEIELEYITWHAPDCPEIVIRRRVMEGIDHEVNEVFAAVPRRGAETGGLLLGRRDGERIVIDDFEPVPSEHRFGPSYRLSEKDCALLQETLEWFRADTQSGLAVLGFYRSHTMPDFGLSEQDEELVRTHFPELEPVVLLIKPSRTAGSVADFFIQRNGRAEEAFMPMPFPFTGSVSEPPVPALESGEPDPLPSGPEPSPSAAPAPVAWPPPRPRLSFENTQPSPKRMWLWYTAAAALGIIGGALGYLSLHPDTSAAQLPGRIAPARTTPTAPAPPPAEAPATPTEAPSVALAERAGEEAAGAGKSDAAAIHSLLDRWSGALRGGDAQAAAQCYTPVLAAYYGRREVTREAVRQSIKQSLMRNGHLDIFRISDLQITPVGDGRAVATFRKHWQTSGYRKSAGEEQDRLSLVRTQGAWQIASEQEQKLYWVHRPTR